MSVLSPPTLRCDMLQPFGLRVQAASGTALWQLDAETLKAWVAEHGVVVLSGFAPLAKTELPLFCRRLGEPLIRDFGTVNEFRALPESSLAETVDQAGEGRTSVSSRYVFFQCLQAQADETMFVDTRRLLRDPGLEPGLAHVWQSGDYLLADNQALLHGPSTDLNESGPHLRRVDILPETRADWTTRLLAQLRIRRLEYLVAYIPSLLMPVLLASGPAAILSQPLVWVGLLTLYLLFNLGDMINCLADRDLDAVYKPRLSRAIHAIGVENLQRQLGLWSLAGLAVCVYVAWGLNQWLLPPLWLVGLWLGAQYSLPPWRMKSGGLWQLAGWWGIMFAGPMLFATLLVAPAPSLESLLFTLSFGLIQCGILLVNSAEDYPEDLETGMRTVIVALGPVRGMSWAAWLVTLAGSLHLVLLLRLSQHSPLALHGLTLLGTLFWLWVSIRLWMLKLRVEATPLQAMDLIRREARLVPLSMTVIALGNLAWVLLWSFYRGG